MTHALDDLSALLDDRDRNAVVREAGGEMGAGLAAADNDDLHDSS